MKKKVFILGGIVVLISLAAAAAIFLFNKQKYQVYRAEDFEIKYPDWPKVDERNVFDPQRTKLAVANNGCNFVINAIAIPENTTFKEYTKKSAQEQIAKTKSKIITQNIQDNTAYFEGEVPMGNTTLYSISYSYLTSGRQSYGIAFIAEKSVFETACRPFIDKVVGGVRAK